MALPVLDGNQSATTLSSVVTGGEHIVAHSVVSLGTTAISNINSAVSGSAVTIPGLARISNSIASDGAADANLDFIKIGGHQDGQNQVAHIVHVSAGGAMKVDASGSSVTFSQAPVTFGAITGSASILNFPSTQTIAGTVTANVLGLLKQDGGASGDGVQIYGYNADNDAAQMLRANASGALNVSVENNISGTVTVGNSVTIGSLPAISGTVTANLGGYSQTAVSYSGSSVTAIPVALQTNGVYGGTLLAYNGANTYLRVGLDAVGGNSLAFGGSVPISGTVTVGNSVTIGSLPAISGTVTANAGGDFGGAIEIVNDISNVSHKIAVQLYDDNGGAIGVSSNPLPISGTVTVGNNNFNIKTVIAQDGSANFTAFNGTQFRLYTPTGASKTLNNIFGAIPSWVVAFSDSVTWFSDSGTQVAYFHDGTQWTLDDFTTPAGTLALDGSVFITNLSSESSINLLNGFTASQVGSAFVNGSGALRVSLYSSTVTAAAPNGSLTTRFGTPTTASVAFATSCVTNANRKYLLIQNVTTGSNVITVGIGFTPTTTQGIQLTAGAGITFESSYIPTGAVYVLSSVTASNFTILEA